MASWLSTFFRDDGAAVAELVNFHACNPCESARGTAVSPEELRAERFSRLTDWHKREECDRVILSCSAVEKARATVGLTPNLHTELCRLLQLTDQNRSHSSQQSTEISEGFSERTVKSNKTKLLQARLYLAANHFPAAANLFEEVVRSLEFLHGPESVETEEAVGLAASARAAETNVV